MRFLALIILVLLILIRHSNASTLECFTDEPRRYEFDLGAQKVGAYRVEVKHETGKLAGLTYNFVIRDVASLKDYEDYLTKRTSVGVPYTITYALRCKQL
jgi:hypothetical protein